MQESFNLLHLILCILSVCASAKDKEGILSICLNCCNLIFILFLIAWMIAGSVWVWRSLDDWQNDHHKCSDALFISATICVSLYYVVMLLLCCCCACAIFQLCSLENIHTWTKMTIYTQNKYFHWTCTHMLCSCITKYRLACIWGHGNKPHMHFQNTSVCLQNENRYILLSACICNYMQMQVVRSRLSSSLIGSLFCVDPPVPGKCR